MLLFRVPFLVVVVAVTVVVVTVVVVVVVVVVIVVVRFSYVSGVNENANGAYD